MRGWFSGGTRTVLAVVVTAVVASAATAGAASLITGKQIKDGTINAKDLSKALRNQLNQTGPLGPQGAAGKDGAQGSAGKDGSPDTPEQVRDKLLTVDGSGSGLDADRLDGKGSSAFAVAGSEAWHEIGAPGEPGFGYGGNQFNSCVWSNVPSNYGKAAFFRDPAGVVHLKGLIRGAEANPAGTFTCDVAIQDSDVLLEPTIVRLPSGYRPERIETFATVSGQKFGRVDAYADGRISPTPPTTFADVALWLSLSGISFRCGPAGVNGCP